MEEPKVVTDEELKDFGLNVEDAKLPDENGVAPVDVVAMLKEKANKTQHVLGGKQGAALAESLTEEQQGSSDRVTLDYNDINGPHVKPIMASTAWHTDAGDDIGEVVLTEDDRDRYFRHMVHDVPFTFLITQGSGDRKFEVEIRSLNVGESEVAFMAATEDAQKSDKLFPSEIGLSYFNNYLGFLQKYLAAAQVVKLAGKSLEAFTWSGSILDITEKEKALKDLRRAKTEAVDGLSEAKWALVFRAIRVFEVKLKLCKEAMINGNF